MSVGTTSAILASIVSLTVAIAILLRRPRRPLYQFFSAFTFTLFLWHAASVASRLTGGELVRLQLVAALLLPPMAILFFRELLRDRGIASRQLSRIAFGVSSLLIIPAITPLGDELPFRVVCTAYVLGAMALVFNNLYIRTSSARSDDKKRLRFLFYGGVSALLLATGELVPAGDVWAALGHVAATFYIYFLYQSILARRLVDLVELLGKAAVLLTLTFLLASVYSLLVLWVGSNQQGLWLFNTLVASFVILILYDQVRPWIEETTAKLLFREGYELRQVLRRLLRVLRMTITLPEMRKQVLDALHTSGRASQASVYLQVEGDPSFRLNGYRGQKPPEVLSTAQQPSLLAELRRERKPVLLEHIILRQQELPTLLTGDDPMLQRELDRMGEAVAAMRQIGASVIVPMLIEDRIVGILCLGAEHLTESYSMDELSALLSLAEACAVVIENSHEYEKQRERDRLVAIGEMAAGMAHEIRNPLGAIKGAAQCLDPQQLPKEANEFIGVIVEEVDRLNGVVSQFLEYARPYRGNPIPVNVNDVISATLKLLARDAIPQAVHVREDKAAELPLVSMDPEQLKQVLINLVRNAIQAMPQGGQIIVSTSVSLGRGEYSASAPRGTETAYVVVRVVDSGSGIRAEDLPRIFVPFFTTKASGTGLGLAISQRIVENAGGRLEVSSSIGEGSTFTIRLPAVVVARADEAPSANPNMEGEAIKTPLLH
jgi:two-component system, NtrC family, sensor histidine kinase HydH